MKLLDQYYKGSQQQLDANREAATQKADIAYQKAQNYMPIINKQNGLSGLGVSESATLDMYNKHLNRQSGIDSTYDSASRDLFQNYLTDRQGILDKEKEDKMQNYLSALELMTSGEFSDVEGLGRYLNELHWSGMIDDNQMKTLTQRFENIRTSPTYADKLGNTHHDWEAMRKQNPEVTDESAYPYKTMLTDMSKWRAVDKGGSWVGAFNNDAVVKAPNGENLSIDQLYEILTTQEGMSDDEAEEFIVQLQKHLGITS